MKKGLIFGITGQDGSYLAELLLEKEYEVHGVIRRASNFNTQRIEHIYNNPNLKLHYGDVTDPLNVANLINELKPDEIYNLAAMSHVKVSFETPYYTSNADAIGTLNILESIRTHSPSSKFYQAGTSEMFGKVQEIPQTENTPFYPRSPYGVAKLYSHWIVKNYRESYGLFACNGILFNHETLGEKMPVIIKKNGLLYIKPISEVVLKDLNKEPVFNLEHEEYQAVEPTENVFIWDKKGWTKILYASGYPHKPNIEDKKPLFINSKKSCYFATENHHCIMEDNTEKEFKNIKIGDKVSLTENLPIFNNIDNISEIEAELLGFIIADGNYNRKYSIRLTQKNKEVLEYYSKIFHELYNIQPMKKITKSGFTNMYDIYQYTFNCKEFIEKYSIYNLYKEKQIPYQILNSTLSIKEAFLKGYYKGDGLKKDKTVYEYKSFKTNSATLAMGLISLFKEVTKQEYNINVFTYNDNFYYQINLLSNSNYSQSKSIDKYHLVKKLLKEGKSQRKIQRETTISRGFIRKVQNGYIPNGVHHSSKNNNEVKKIISDNDYKGWFFDITTETGTFHAGVGEGHIHNSPRRGSTFVTKKITEKFADIYHGDTTPLKIGNMEAQRDWGYAPEYTEGMWRMLQQNEPDDFLLATNKTYTIRYFIEETAKHIGHTIRWEGEGEDEKGYSNETGQLLVEIDPEYFRPAEVELLIGNPSKAKEKLGWEAKVGLDELISIMIKHDIDEKRNK